MTRNEAKSDFPARLTALLERLNLSRGALARELQIDKSVIARWLAGTNQPTMHNLTRLTELLRRVEPDATTAHWHGPAAALRVTQGLVKQSLVKQGLVVQTRQAVMQDRAPTGLEAIYDGLWGGFCHTSEGPVVRPMMLRLRAGDDGISADLTDGTNICTGFALTTDSFLQVILETSFLQRRLWMMTFNGVFDAHGSVMTGFLMTGFPGMQQSPSVTATPMVLVRLGDLQAWESIGGEAGATATLLRWRNDKAAIEIQPDDPHSKWHTHADPQLIEALCLKVGVAYPDGETDVVARMPRSRQLSLTGSHFAAGSGAVAVTIARLRAALGLD